MNLATYFKIDAAGNSVAARVYKHRARLLFCLRMTVAAAASLALVRIFSFPFHGLWAVLTAVVVMQVKTDATEAEARLQNFKQAGSESWTALSGALAETRKAFDEANRSAWDAFKRAAPPRA